LQKLKKNSNELIKDKIYETADWLFRIDYTIFYFNKRIFLLKKNYPLAKNIQEKNNLEIINDKLKIPRIIMKNIIMYYLDVESIKNIFILSNFFKELNIFNERDKMFIMNISKGFVHCCSRGHIDEAKWLFLRKKLRNSIFEKSNHIKYALKKSCRNGQLEIIKWFHTLNIVIKEKDYFNAFKKSCKYGHLDVAKFLFNVDKVKKKIHMENEFLFYESCRYGHFQIAKWLYNIEKNNISIEKNNISIEKNSISPKNEKSFVVSCMNGHFEISKWIHRKCEKIGVIIDKYNECFGLVCKNGHVTIAQWLLDIFNFKINIHADNEYAFRQSCENGHIDIAKWLYNISIENDNKINIHIRQDYAFYKSCINGHLEIAKWLYELGQINIYYQENYCLLWNTVYINSTFGRHHQVRNWLLSLKKNNLNDISKI
jgi:hypothetical protein